MLKQYKIVDILHSGNSGIRNQSKIGEKYKNRKGKLFEIDESVTAHS